MMLFEAGKIGRLETKNRIVMAPMNIGGLVEPDGRISQRAIDYYAERAKGGVGLITVAVAWVSHELEQIPGTPFTTFPMLDSPIYVTRLTELADACHEYGAKVCIQVTGGFGRVSGLPVFKAGAAVGPSVLPSFWSSDYKTRALSTEEVERLAQSFQPAAELVATAGIDAIELHGHGGYLFDQFMTALWNKRTDKYGGDLQGKLRLTMEAIEAVRRGAGKDYPLIYRFGLTHRLPGGREIDEGLEIARLLEAAGVDALHVNAGCYDTWYETHPPTTMPPGSTIHLSEVAKEAVNLPVIAVGKLGNPDLAESVLQEGKADFIALGRPLLADPEWPRKVKEGRVEDIRPCLGDHECLNRQRERKYLSCTVNPATGMEQKYTLTPAEIKKSVLVIGGGPGGMEAARVAAVRGHKVTIWEKESEMGGNLRPAAAPDFKEEYKQYIGYLERQIKKLGVTIELNKEATPEMVLQEKPDVVIIAVGGTPVIPDIPGNDRASVVTAVDLLMGKRESGSSVAVIGGGMIGCEAALFLARQGKQVTVLEVLENAAPDCIMINRMHLLKLLDEAGVKILTSVNVLEVTDEGVVITDKNDIKSTIRADSVALAVGIKPREKIWDTLQDKVPEVYNIGDYVEPRKAVGAIWEGFRTARLI